MKLTIVKPDWRIVGGFEGLLDRLCRGLVDDGVDVSWRTVDVPSVARTPFGVVVRPDVWNDAGEAFEHLALVDAFYHLDPGPADVVVSTQPPSYAVQHPRHLSVFFHHRRVFYDLSPAYAAAGFVDLETHAVAQAAVRRVDARYLPGVDGFLAGSTTVAGRLAEYNGITDGVSLLQAGVELPVDTESDEPRASVLCVSRHEFSKRTELVVHAAAFLPSDVEVVMVGSGGRLPWVTEVAHRLDTGELDREGATEADLWLNRGVVGRGEGRSATRVRFLGRVDDLELAEQYRNCMCVVAPAFLEDYGLTALEAMAHERPVIVCDDGGGLTELVEHEVTGLVVKPDGQSIAAAIERLRGDDGLRRELSRNGRERASAFSWDRARQQFSDAVMSLQ